MEPPIVAITSKDAENRAGITTASRLPIGVIGFLRQRIPITVAMTIMKDGRGVFDSAFKIAIARRIEDRWSVRHHLTIERVPGILEVRHLIATNSVIAGVHTLD